MTKKLIETVKTLITNGPPHQDTLDTIEETGFMVLKTIKLHDMQPDYGMDTDYITFYAKTHLVEMIEGSFMIPDSFALTTCIAGEVLPVPQETTPTISNITSDNTSNNKNSDAANSLRQAMYAGIGIPIDVFNDKYAKPSISIDASKATADLFINKSLPSHILKGLKEQGFTTL